MAEMKKRLSPTPNYNQPMDLTRESHEREALKHERESLHHAREALRHEREALLRSVNIINNNHKDDPAHQAEPDTMTTATAVAFAAMRAEAEKTFQADKEALLEEISLLKEQVKAKEDSIARVDQAMKGIQDRLEEMMERHHTEGEELRVKIRELRWKVLLGDGRGCGYAYGDGEGTPRTSVTMRWGSEVGDRWDARSWVPKTPEKQDEKWSEYQYDGDAW